MAYIDLIQESQYFIYIENQFFISSLAGDLVKNKIAESLYLRLVEAHENKENFKILILLPLLPAFEGEINEDRAAVLRIQLHWQYRTILRSETSLFEKLRKDGIDPDQYIKFIGLRTHAIMNNVPVTELVYVHSKCMIVDDSKVIIGSANINDRSMNGNRDSEIAMVIEDSSIVESSMNGIPFEARKFAFEFRSKIWQEIFGMTAEEVHDPLDENLWKQIDKVVKQNTEIYHDIFGCYPDNAILEKADVDNIKVQKPDLQLYNQKKDKIQGFAVDFPLHFMEKVNLTFQFLDIKNKLAPEHVYT